MATERTTMTPEGQVIFLDENKEAMTPNGEVISFEDFAAPVVTTIPVFMNHYRNQGIS